MNKRDVVEDNTNPNAKIGFVIFYPFQYYVYKNVYVHLKDEAEFIVDAGVFFPIEQHHDLVDDLVVLLKKERVNFRILNYSDYHFENYLEDFFSKYETLVSVWHRGCMRLQCNIDKKKVHLTYGVGKELTTYGLYKRLFDLILAYGEYDHSFFSLYTQSVIVGNPKFDDWFNKTLDNNVTKIIRDRLDPDKQTVLYLPTHSDLCSIDELAEELKELASDYNVIVKLHYYTIREEPERVKKLTDERIILYKDDTDLLQLFKVANVVLSDNSSAIFDAILADKPIITTDFHSNDFLDVEHKKIKDRRRGKTMALTYSNSIEQRIKQDGTTITIHKPEELSTQVNKTLKNDIPQKKKRRQLRERLFSYNDGSSGARAATAIKELSGKKPSEKPIFYHLAEALEQNVLESVGLRYMNEREDYKRLCAYRSFSRGLMEKDVPENEPVFSIVVLPISNDISATKEANRSLHLQEFPHENYEIITNDLQLPIVSFLKESIIKARGGYVCFIGNTCVAPIDWLTRMYMTHKKHPDAVAVGGNIVRHSPLYNLYDEFDYFELGKKFGIQKEPKFIGLLYEIRNGLFWQNPAGKLSNISYRKDVLKKIQLPQEMQTIQLLEMWIKKQALDLGGDMVFTPLSVTDLECQTSKSFFKDRLREGVAYTLTGIRHPNLKKYYTVSIISIVSNSLPLLRPNRRDMLLFLVALWGNSIRLLGKYLTLLMKNQSIKKS
ncbi:MAG: CDP-glycerol glycerophosphotransferase family protein [Candidatus Pacebacteria bacterium]|nr:CDP-glycerol glycerophosphotransferase family protein [Candidatus Paceibacterota bacterium]